MIEWIFGFFALLSFLKGVRIVLKKNKKYDPQSIQKGAESQYIKKGKTGIILIHGFTGSPYDLKEIGRKFSKKGLTVSIPLLPGHGTSPENLATKNDRDWEKEVKRAYDEIKKDCDKIYMAGVSFGGNLAINLAKEEKIEGLILLGTPIYFRKERFMTALWYFLRLWKDFFKKGNRVYTQLSEKVRRKRITYMRVPLNTIKYVLRQIKNSKHNIKDVSSALLIMMSTADSGVHEKSVIYLYNHSPSRHKKIVWIENAYHVITIDKPANITFDAIMDFIENKPKVSKKHISGPW